MDLDKTVIRMGGRDFTAWNLTQGAAFSAVGIGCAVAGLATDMRWLLIVALVLVAIGVGTAFGR